MQPELETAYNQIRSGSTGYHEQKRGLISVHGKEAVQFLDGLISNDMKTLEDGTQMLAAFPNAQGRLLALVRVLRQGDKFLFETEAATREKVFNNLFRFTYAGDFFVEDLSDTYRFFSIFGKSDLPATQSSLKFDSASGADYFVLKEVAEDFLAQLRDVGDQRSGQDVRGPVAISDELYETLRIESGIPKYGVDMDETTIVPELGLEGLISYKKGCYIGQEIIARIHFRGHVAKQLTGLIFPYPPEGAGEAGSEPRVVPNGFLPGEELKTADGKNAGRITSVAFLPKQAKAIAYVRYDYLTEGTELRLGDQIAIVTNKGFSLI